MRPLFALAAVAALTVACGGGNTPTSPGPAGLAPPTPTAPGTSLSRGTMSAVVDGISWEATTPTALLGGLAGLTSLSGSASLGGLRISLILPGAVGTHTLNLASLVSCSVSENLATRFWLASPFETGSTCTVTVTTHTPTRVAGVFSFTAVSGPGVSPRPLFALAAVAALTVACGGRNTPTSPSLPSLPSGSVGITMLTRGTVRATVDGTRWESASPLASSGMSTAAGVQLMTLTASSVGDGISLSITGPLALGTHAAGGSAPVFFTLLQGFGPSWGVNPFGPGSSGTLTLTTATPTRVAGTFAFTATTLTQGLMPPTRTVTDGAFDVSQ